MTQTARPAHLLRGTPNLVPLPYRGVSVQPYDGEMSEAGITDHLLGREAYRRTEFIVLRAPDLRHAVVAVNTQDRDPLFSPIDRVEILALPDDCIHVRDSKTDCGNRSALAALALAHEIGADRTLICEGKFDHVNFIHCPRPLIVKVIEIAPPEPPKLFDLVTHVLSYADLPPIVPVLERIELAALLRGPLPAAFLVPCRSGGLDNLGAPVHYLDERPPARENWTLIGCERSLQFHRHYYGDEPPRIEMCPRVIAGARSEPTILKCCLLEFDVERDGDMAIVPWGADLPMVERALRMLAQSRERPS